MAAMEHHDENSSLRFLKQPNRVQCKFERSFTAAVKLNRHDLMDKFPDGCVRTCYVA